MKPYQISFFFLFQHPNAENIYLYSPQSPAPPPKKKLEDSPTKGYYDP